MHELELEPLFKVNLLGHYYDFSYNILIQWIIIILIIGVSIYLTRNLKKIPEKRQAIAEIFVEGIGSFVKSTMGENYTMFVSYVGTLGLFLITMNLTGLFGIEPPTKDYSVALGMGLTTFLVIQGYTIKKIGLGHYLLGYVKPAAFMVPMNILERILLPVSLSLRLFGNITAAAAIMGVIYEMLSHLSWFAQIGLPVPLHVYFDIFDGGVQMIVFTMLTMINLKVIAEH